MAEPEEAPPSPKKSLQAAKALDASLNGIEPGPGGSVRRPHGMSTDKGAKFKGRHTEAIVVAAAAGNAALLERMLRPPDKVTAHPADVNSTDASGKTALMWAVRNNRAKVLNLLLHTAEDLELDLRDKSGHTALLHAVWGKRYNLLRRLLAAGCDREVRDHVGRTPVCVATYIGDARSLRVLLDASTHPARVPADVNATDCAGRTPLFHAVVGCTSSEQRTRETLEELLRDEVRLEMTCCVRMASLIHSNSNRHMLRDEVRLAMTCRGRMASLTTQRITVTCSATRCAEIWRVVEG